MKAAKKGERERKRKVNSFNLGDEYRDLNIHFV